MEFRAIPDSGGVAGGDGAAVRTSAKGLGERFGTTHARSTLRVVIADSDAGNRASIRAALEGVDDIRVLGEADEGHACVTEVCQKRPDVVVVAAGLPSFDGVAACAALKRLERAPRVVLVVPVTAGDTLLEAVEAGADGYVVQDGELASLPEAVHQVSRGDTVIPSDMLGSLLQSLLARTRREDRAVELFMRLTRRERAVLALLIDGCDRGAVATALSISPQTARTHIQHIIEKLGVHSRREAVALAGELGFAEWMAGRTP